MKKTFLKALVLIALSLNFIGCSSKNADGLNLPSNSVVEKNSNTKIYYEDNLNTDIKTKLEKLSNYINTNGITPNIVITNSPKSSTYNNYCSEYKYTKDTNPTKFVLNTVVDNSKNVIIINKKYSSKDEIYEDLVKISWSLFETFNKNSNLSDEFGTSSFIIPEESLIKDNIAAFTIKKEIVRRSVLDKPIKQLELGGYKIVNNPSDADKIIYFDLTRDYKKSELERLKKEGKGINYSVVNAGTDNTQIMNTTMNFASHSNNASTSIASGIGAGLAISFLDGIMAQNIDYSVVFPSMKIIDKKSNKSYIQLFEMGFIYHDRVEKGLTKIDQLELRSFIDRINNGMNRFTDSAMFQQIPLN